MEIIAGLGPGRRGGAGGVAPARYCLYPSIIEFQMKVREDFTITEKGLQALSLRFTSTYRGVNVLLA